MRPLVFLMSLLPTVVLGATSSLNNAQLYWRIVDAKGRLLANVSSYYDGLPKLRKTLQNEYPGIRLSIRNCRQPTFAESMNPVYGKDWQCGVVTYTRLIHQHKAVAPVLRFPPKNSQWRYFGQDAGNNVMFINQAHTSRGHIFIWTEDYNSYLLADAIHQRTGVNLNVIEEHINPVPDLPMTSLSKYGTSLAAIRKTASKIIDANPLRIGGSSYRGSGRAEKWLFEIDCASRHMRSVETLGVNGEIDNLAGNHAAPWYSPVQDIGRFNLMQFECRRLSQKSLR